MEREQHSAGDLLTDDRTAHKLTPEANIRMPHLKKLLIRCWFGPLPNWAGNWAAHTAYLKRFGWDFLIVNDFRWYSERVKEVLGVTPTETAIGTRKCGDWDPLIGELFAPEVAGYDFWGHSNLDAVYGRLSHFLPDSYLESVDIFGNDSGAICGPFSLYRNAPAINELWRFAGVGEHELFGVKYYGFDEAQFSRLVERQGKLGTIRFKSGFHQSHDKMPQHQNGVKVRLESDGRLIDYGLEPEREIMMFHFNKVREWPV
jgi:hypothetical protein